MMDATGGTHPEGARADARPPSPLSGPGEGLSGPPAPAPGPDITPLRRAERIYRELRTLLWEAMKRRRGEATVRRGHKLEVRIQMDPHEEPLEPGQAPPERRFAEELLSRIERAVDLEAERNAPFPPGRVRCYWCDSFECPHSAPPGPRSVFGGYSPTGVPLWPDLASVVLERRHPRIEDLYREVPIPLAMVQPGSALVSEQLPVYGRRSGIYRILGQVEVGYLPVPAGPRGESSSVALTFQAVEVERGRPRIHLNVLGRLPDGEDLGRLLEEGADQRIGDALRAARLRLSEIRPRRGRRAPPPYRAVMAVLEGLARNLDRIFRQEARRTKHSRERHMDRERPAAAALRDAMAARPEEIYRDVRESTWVILGPRSRVHIFNDQGQHITSVVYPGETVRRRTAQGMWRLAPPGSVQGFRAAVERSAASRKEAL